MKYIIIFILTLSPIFSKSIKSDFDYAIYKHSDDSLKIEVYFEFNSLDLDYVYNNSIYKSKIIFKSSFKSLLNEYVIDWDFESIENDLKLNKLVFGVKQIILPISQYDVNIDFYIESNNELSGNKKFKIIPKSKDIYLSDIYLATRITKKDTSKIAWSEIFSKGDYYIIPNSSRQYFSDQATLLSYIEIYNSKKVNIKSFIIKYKIIDAIGTVKKVVTKKFINLNENILNDHLAIPIPDLATGVYFLETKLYSDDEKTEIDISKKKFFYMNFDVAPELNAKFTEDELFERSEYVTLDDTTLLREYDKIKYLMTKDEKIRWDELSDLKAKQRALFTFWRIRDSDTTTIYNESKSDFDKAVNYALEYFTYNKDYEGWRTDRGKVLLKYGFPMVVERYPRNGEKIPCEIWYYGEGGGGAYFYFVDNTGYNNFILVHSTIFGENQNEYWMQDYNPAVNFDMNVKRSEHYFK